MANSRQAEVESNSPFIRNGHWHRPDGAFASDSEAKEYERQFGKNALHRDRQPPRVTTTNHTKKRAYNRKPRPEQEHHDEPQAGRLSELMTEFHDLHEKMGMVAAEIEKEINAISDPIQALLARFVPKVATDEEPEDQEPETKAEEEEEE